MGADAEVERHDGTPLGEDEIAARMRAEGLVPHEWGNGPGDTFGWHEHGYEKVLYCVRGRIVSTPPAVTSISARETRWSSRRTPRTRQRSARRCALHGSAPSVKLEPGLTGSVTRETCTMTCRGAYVPHRGTHKGHHCHP